jgi:hypothetical protein
MRFRVQVVAIAVIVLCGGQAFAQGTYVSAAVLADIVRATHAEYPGAPDGLGGGEAIGFALRAGTPLGSAWGVELEFARPSEIENVFEPEVFAQMSLSYTFIDGSSLVPGVDALFPSFRYSVRTNQRHTTLSAALWLQQQLTSRVSLVYLGGAAFSRTESESEISFSPFATGVPIRIFPPPTRTETILYGVRPMVGFESRIEMTEHAHLVPGVRLQAGEGRWLIRPAVGIAWTF